MRPATSAAFTAARLVGGRRVTTVPVQRIAALPLSSASLPTRAYSNDSIQLRIPRERSPANLGLVIVPQQKAYVIERLGKYHATLGAGLHFLIPFFDRISAVHSLKEQTIGVPGQAAITKDNVRIDIDAVLYMRIVDPKAASYGVEHPHFALTQLAQTTMRSELGKITLDRVFEEREVLNQNIVQAVNNAAAPWGAEVLRFEIRDIIPPASLRSAMDLQAEAERRKRAEILESEGRRQSAINLAEGQKESAVLSAQGDALAVLHRARAASQALEMVAQALQKPGGREAVSLRVAEQYVEAFGKIAKQGTTMLLPADAANPSSMIAQALGVWQTVSRGSSSAAAGTSPSGDSSPSSAAPASLTDSLAELDSMLGIKKPASSAGADSGDAAAEGFKPQPF